MKRRLLFLMPFLMLVLCAKSQVIITGYNADPRAANAGIPGDLLLAGQTATHLGGFDYMQFKATQDIDFSETPYTVIVNSNVGNAQTVTPGYLVNGWITGGMRTYKFNLTSGKVKKGGFFYVGGMEKRINGSLNGIKSTDISETADVETNRANWIRAKAYTAEAGDDNKHNADPAAPLGLIRVYNGTTALAVLANSGATAGFAIFSGINVLESSIPIDAIFYNVGNGTNGITSAKIYDATNGTGLRVPNNDLYSNVYNSVPQPFMGQGTNNISKALAAPTGDGYFCKLSGVFDAETNTWKTARTANYFMPAQTDPLSVIETGSNVTVLPVRFTLFTGKLQNKSVRLNWVTASEQNNSHFNVLRSSDGKNFETIGKVLGAGAANSYQFTDTNPLAGTNYYRLEQVDFNGDKDFSRTIYVTTNLAGVQLSVYANSAEQAISINIYAIKNQKANIVITGISGQKMGSQLIDLQKGYNNVKLPITLQKGAYIATLTTDNEKVSTKFIK